MKINKTTLFFAFILAFALWYFIVYKKEMSKALSGEFPIPGVENEHIIWGYPVSSNDKIYRYKGLVLGYNEKRKNPDWVSYHITKEYISGKKFLDKRKFKSDPTIEDRSRVRTSDYTNSGYDRGHLAAQADMRGRDLQCESESCYLTNIAPQKPDFNRKTWLNLENAVRKWTEKYGESWVLAGTIYDDQSTFIKEKIEIPDAFYKIIIINDGNSFISNSFVIYQDNSSYNLEEYIVSIDSVEKATGIDFFSELEDGLEDNFESRVNRVLVGWR
ncbi:MAG: DNA/RNA non-specific endonuclease [Candidatus Delongbacteria bacterium]|nr:DNA/RNA non-specific endonuclease [Candidatus Delongbacteria bacterium]